MKEINRKPTEDMYTAGMKYLTSKGTNWCINDLFSAMYDAAPESDGCIDCHEAPENCEGDKNCKLHNNIERSAAI